MRVMFGLVLAALLFYTILVENTGILMTKLSLRCLLYIFSVMSFHLWLRGMGWKGMLAHLAAILLILCTEDSKPNSAAPLLLFGWRHAPPLEDGAVVAADRHAALVALEPPHIGHVRRVAAEGNPVPGAEILGQKTIRVDLRRVGPTPARPRCRC